ncbi:unnamed protein product [Paramecium octaurelia]|uniref:Uncharacterized protein n=1 Tax=Paramecium octaurelia TaxID=43137 RepID=A0A8S1VHK8_PAROT|nr:unnamed protein product [Paramecium octaurelia]
MHSHTLSILKQQYLKTIDTLSCQQKIISTASALKNFKLVDVVHRNPEVTHNLQTIKLEYLIIYFQKQSLLVLECFSGRSQAQKIGYFVQLNNILNEKGMIHRHFIKNSNKNRPNQKQQ